MEFTRKASRLNILLDPTRRHQMSVVIQVFHHRFVPYTGTLLMDTKLWQSLAHYDNGKEQFEMKKIRSLSRGD